LERGTCILQPNLKEEMTESISEADDGM